MVETGQTAKTFSPGDRSGSASQPVAYTGAMRIALGFVGGLAVGFLALLPVAVVLGLFIRLLGMDSAMDRLEEPLLGIGGPVLSGGG